MEIRNPEQTLREMEIILTDALHRNLNPLEQEIVNDAVAYQDEKRIAFLELIKELINKT
ncbi:hypothetical protein [Bacillus sp. CECT 9360]|uniref:hypothetical protein n=1 Tax=Bacillus sp. CECT 9360 TaxID=2845821 RepID=UPI001E33BB13|nr:hypothetical protein [Bacillus sp. CECT 9360]CAH0345812.1 hypothetical protein BCI9360_02113 [Bacillus sp. CECT 9360]